MTRRLLILGLSAVCLVMVAASPTPGTPRIKRWVIGGGGGGATVGDISLRSTVGQWAAGSGGSGDSRLQHGFWPGVTAATENHALYLPVIFN
jgi:hypothetical protein